MCNLLQKKRDTGEARETRNSESNRQCGVAASGNLMRLAMFCAATSILALKQRSGSNERRLGSCEWQAGTVGSDLARRGREKSSGVLGKWSGL